MTLLKDSDALVGNSGSGRLLARLRHSAPSRGVAMGGAVLWAAAMGASAYVNLVLYAWETPAKIHFVAALFAAGGALAFPPGFLLARLLAGSKRRDTAFAAAFVAFAATTIVTTAALYALQYRFYYSEWHADAFTVTWMFQLVFTTLAALYQFAVLGIRLLFPIGFAALFAVAFWFVRRPS